MASRKRLGERLLEQGVITQQQLSDIIFNVTEKFAGRLVVKITDAQSPQAMWKALRKGIREYPTFLIENDRYYGLEEDHIVELIERHLPQSSG